MKTTFFLCFANDGRLHLDFLLVEFVDNRRYPLLLLDRTEHFSTDFLKENLLPCSLESSDHENLETREGNPLAWIRVSKRDQNRPLARLRNKRKGKRDRTAGEAFIQNDDYIGSLLPKTPSNPNSK